MLITEKFAEFVEKLFYNDLPEETIDLAKQRIMDTLGASIAGGANWDYTEQLKEACRHMGAGNFHTVGDTKDEFPAARCAMINATFAHAIELDDGHRNAGCHAGAVVVPTALALGWELKKSGKDIITAVVAGYEVVYRIASHVNPFQINKGFHPSSNCDTYGAAAVAGKLLGLNKEQLANAMGQAGMFSSGTMEATKNGQRAKCVQVGNAAFNGILAAYLAQTGMEGCKSALEGGHGLFNTQSENVDVEDVTRGLGESYLIGDTYSKLYPCCRHAQPGIEAVLDLTAEHQLTPDQVKEIHIGTHKVAYELTGHIKEPHNSGEAKFSLAYGSALALYEHSFGVDHLKEKYYTNPDILALANKVECHLDPAVQAKFPKQRGAKVEIELNDGKTYSKELYFLKASPENPVGWDVLEEKFRNCASATIPAATVNQIVDFLAHLEKQDSIAPLMNLV